MAAIDFPANPILNQQYSQGTTTWQWDGIGWNIVPQMGPLFVGDLPPSNPAAGQQWFRTTNCCLYVWYNDGNSSQWVQSQGSNAAPGIWEPIVSYNLAGKNEQIFGDLVNFRRLRMSLEVVQSASGINYMLVSSDNGLTFPNPASSYAASGLLQSGATVTGLAFATTNTSTTVSSTATDAGSSIPLTGTTLVNNFNTSGVLSFFQHDYLVVVAGVPRREFMYGYRNSPTAWNALKLAVNAGTWVSGYAYLEGIRG